MLRSDSIEACRTVIAGEFVRLRPIQADDAELTLDWRLSARAALLHRGAQSIDAQRNWISTRPASELNYIIETWSAFPLGMLSLIDIDRMHRRAEPARFLIGNEDAAKGIPAAVEAMKLLYEVAFDRLGLQRVYGTVVEDNPQMLRWQLYLGMRTEGCLRRHAWINDRFQDLTCVGMLESEYRSAALPRMCALIAMARAGKARAKGLEL